MIERLEVIVKRYNEIKDELASPEIISDIKKMTELSKEQTRLEKTVELYDKYKQVIDDIEAAKEMVKDKDLMEFAKEELARLEKEQADITSKLEVELLPHDPNDEKNVIVEIRGAAGGDEGNIFAGDLFDMYSKYATNEGWKIEVLNSTEGAAGGYTNIEFMVKGEAVYSKLKYESGSHRVQRVPATESQGRVHTSTATVLVMPEAEEFDFELNMDEVRVDITRSSGCGGQGVNTTDSAVRITHLPTGIVVTCQNERSQIQNKEHCLEILRSKLYVLEQEKKDKELNLIKGEEVSNGFGSAKRSYVMCPYTLVKDNDTNYEEVNVNKVLDGDIEEFIKEELKMG